MSSVVATSPHFLSARTDWPTPRAYFDQVHAERDFTLDVCASAENACLLRFLTEQDEALLRSWHGERVWCNPPYGRQIARWMAKCHTEAGHAEIIAALVPSRTDTAWWHDYAMHADEIHFLRGRLRFGEATSNAPFPSALIVWGS